MREDWNFSQIWNKSLEEREEREVVERNHIWASELGKPYIDVYLKLRGTKPTNPPDARSRRKFEAGNIWEFIVKLILIRAGILQEEQTKAVFQYPGLIEVTGKMDFKAGGKPDWEKVKKDIEEFKALGLPEIFSRAVYNMIEHFEKNYPEGLEPRPLEMKSVSAFVFDLLENKKNASLKIHRLQIYHYLKSLNYKRGDVIYICRDDCRMMEVPVYLNSFVEDEYKAYIEGITKYHNANEQPPLEKPVVFDEDFGKFSKNNMVAWSGYLSLLYGIENQGAFDEKYRPMAERWNRVLTRVKLGKKMTDKNLSALKEVEEAGFNIEAIMEKLVPEPEEALEVKKE